jgi:hypothetical protein
MVRKRNRKGILMLSCKDVTQLISQSMDTSLPIGKRIGVRIHLFLCRFCQRYEKQLLFIRETMQHLVAAEGASEGPPVEGLSEEARERIRTTLRNP